MAVGGSPLVKFEHEVAHGSIKGACIVENAAVTGAEFKMRLNRVKVPPPPSLSRALSVPLARSTVHARRLR